MLSCLTESELLSMMRDGNSKAFDEVYERYWLKLYVEAFKRLRSEDDAKDLVQDLFITLWARKQTLVVNKSLGAYLYTSIKHRVLNFIAANAVKGDYIDSLSVTIADYDNSSYERIISDDLQLFIDQRIDNLSPRVKEVYLLSRNENLSVKEIAAKLNVSDQTVKNQLTKALKDLRISISDISPTLSILLPFYAAF